MEQKVHRGTNTVVFQAWVGRPAPAFIERCMASASDWARSRGFEYRRLGEPFLDVLPGWYRDRLGSHILQQTNLARLRYARETLREGADRAIWLDADVLVYDPDGFALDASEGFALCREVWMQPQRDDAACMFGVNQAVVVADRNAPLLDELIDAHESLVRDRPENVQRFGTATALLSSMHETRPLPLLTNVAMLNPAMLVEIAGGDAGAVTREYVRRHGYPTQAANLTLSMVGVDFGGVVATERDFDTAVDVLMRTRGAPLDLARAYGPPPAQSRGTR